MRLPIKPQREVCGFPAWSLNTCAVVAVILAIMGCGGSPRTQVERVTVAGRVTLDGRPLKAGAIVFHCPTLSGDETAITAFGYIKDGQYRIDAEKGPAMGTARVEFRPEPLDREQLEAALDESTQRRHRRGSPPTVVEIPEKYGEQSELQVQLVGGEENRHDFQLESRS